MLLSLLLLQMKLSNKKGIVPLIDMQLEEPPLWLMMKYIEGPNLSEWLRGLGQSVPPMQRVKMLIPVAEAIAESGVPIDYVGGASMGSIVAAAWGMGMSVEEMKAKLRELVAPKGTRVPKGGGRLCTSQLLQEDRYVH